MSDSSDPTTRIEVVRSTSFGSRVAEDEIDDLKSYFVRTEAWRQVRDGEVDVVLAPKGSGKSAIYSMLRSSENELFDERVLLAAGENIKGTPAFSSIKVGEVDEEQFVRIWKLYLLVLILEKMDEFEISNKESKELSDFLRDADLLPDRRPKATVLAMVREYVSRLINPKSAAGTIGMDATTGAVTSVTTKIEFSEPSVAASRAGHVSVDSLFRLAEQALERENYTLWIVLDRLDAAFASSPQLERDALRALFRVYADLSTFTRIALKIFLRDDIWEDVSDEGFREASHFVREAEIKWDSDSLRQLVVRRMTNSSALLTRFGKTAEEVLATTASQEAFFYQVFAGQVDAGSGKTATWDWCLSRTQDGKGVNAPRELIHLFAETRNAQLVRYETGQPAPEGSVLFHPKAFDSALPKVSKTRLTKTIYAEYTDVRRYIEKLSRQKTEQNVESLARLWSVSTEEAQAIAARLVSVGIFSERRSTLWVPFMYRPALEMSQGKADGVA